VFKPVALAKAFEQPVNEFSFPRSDLGKAVRQPRPVVFQRIIRPSV